MGARVIGFAVVLSALCATASLTAVGAPVAVNANSAPAITVERYLAGLATWSADFAQAIEDSHGKVSRRASGHLYLQRPGKFRWDYTQPSEQLVLADGKQLWFYDKDLAQANVHEMSANLAGTPAMLLSGAGSVADQFTITALPFAEGLEWFQLIPKHADTDFQAVRIGFRKGELSRLWLADKLDQVTRLSFSQAKRNVTLAPELFVFTPPAGVDVIGRDPE
jgi:outer membrane lipoprotein carrier protein